MQEFTQKDIYPYVCKESDEEPRSKCPRQVSTLPFTPVRWENLIPGCTYIHSIDWSSSDVQALITKDFPLGLPETKESKEAAKDYGARKIQQAISDSRLRSLVGIGRIDDPNHPCLKDRADTGRHSPPYLVYAKEDLQVNMVLGEYTGLVQLGDATQAEESEQELGHYEVPMGFNCTSSNTCHATWQQRIQSNMPH
jgi:hypothetical protein